MYGFAINARQIRAARAILEWSQEDLARASGLSIATIRKLELGHISPRHSTTQYVRQAIEDAGLEFIQPDGIRRRASNVTIYEGVGGLDAFFDDMIRTVRERGGEILVVANGKAAVPDPIIGRGDLDDVLQANAGAALRCLLIDLAAAPGARARAEFRSISRNYVDPLPFCVYGNKYAILEPLGGSEFRIIVLESLNTALALRRQFASLWEKATPLHLAVQTAVASARLVEGR